MLSTSPPRFVRGRSQHVSHKHFWSRWLYVVVLTMCLTSWLFTDVTGNMSVASAATVQPTKLPVAAVSYTLQQFLKQGKAYKASNKPQVFPNNTNTSLPGINATVASKGMSLPSAQPPTMKAARQQITASFMHAASALAPDTVGNAGNIAPLHIMGNDASGVRLEVIIPVGALDLSRATISGGKAPIGALTLSLAQISGHFGSSMTIPMMTIPVVQD